MSAPAYPAASNRYAAARARAMEAAEVERIEAILGGS
jgi:hypothetical protein